MNRWTLFVTGVLIMTGLTDVFAQERGIVGRPAPSLEVKQWFNVDEKEAQPDVTALKGKVIYLYCFQAWCPGCHSSGFPTLQAVHQAYANDPDVAFLAVQTVFEGFHANTVKRAKEIAKKYKLTMPIGQSGSDQVRSAIMKNYRTGGTPWTIIIGPDGVVRYNDFHISVEKAKALIDSLKSGGEAEGGAPGEHDG